VKVPDLRKDPRNFLFNFFAVPAASKRGKWAFSKIETKKFFCIQQKLLKETTKQDYRIIFIPAYFFIERL